MPIKQKSEPRRSEASVQRKNPSAQTDQAASTLTDVDLHLFNEGSHYKLYEKLGAHPARRSGVEGASFRRLGTRCGRCLGDRRF